MTIIIEKDSTTLISYDTNIIPRIGEHIEYKSERYKITSLIHNITKHSNKVKQNNITIYVEETPN